MNNNTGIAIAVLVALFFGAMMGTLALEHQQQHTCAMTAMKMEKSADDIRKICYRK